VAETEHAQGEPRDRDEDFVLGLNVGPYKRGDKGRQGEQKGMGKRINSVFIGKHGSSIVREGGEKI